MSTAQSSNVIEALRSTSEYTDLTIKCGLNYYKVHKAVVCPQSDWFRAACRPDGFQEGMGNVVELPARGSDLEDGDDPKAIAAMIEFMYGNQSYYTVEAGQEQLLHFVHLLVTADKYLVPTMVEDITQQFHKAIFTLRDRKTSKIIAHLFRLLYTDLPESASKLRNVTLVWITETRADLLTSPEILEAAADDHQFAIDLFTRLAQVRRRLFDNAARSDTDPLCSLFSQSTEVDDFDWYNPFLDAAPSTSMPHQPAPPVNPIARATPVHPPTVANRQCARIDLTGPSSPSLHDQRSAKRRRH
ncbi:hypothetical protein CAC42_5897 [Sphaceloma murrayae]|uniref:BTB domain-containing protein n=1 Tax=Sphaceloma murrayae TaxID=2082308 RepID=A0A2K1QZH6_9PEZI|nr:hypothetical protein CAC42_5897 [Sphaceloma murrayae]